VRLTVLGASAVRPNPGGACAGYLLEHEERRLLIDCGAGALANLQVVADPATLTGVLVSHGHPDHILDLVGMSYGFRHGPGAKPDRPLPLYASATTLEILDEVGRLFGPDTAFWDTFELVEVDEASALEMGDLRVTFAPTVHYLECLAMRFDAPGWSFAFTADTGPTAHLAALTHGVDLLLTECSLACRPGNEAEWGHLAPEEAGELARSAEARKLVLSHYFVENAPARLRAAAAAVYPGPVVVAKELETHVIA
jgi:ribonuclease BN (tRNA processing enzyme)